ncbi:pseudouridine synthase [Alteromonas macleodii]|uniref:Uncharacterized RNA pseudouridine synthase HI_0042 n=1 Tax=Alteromonas macleodii TaxID=28108 RepID=A0A6T9XZH9_ALTMA|nr:pseudouridine synthase [Alteromonas macleodii]CAB9493164.1 Uncharacterized RNA pseudouridine synthase HI_0042 [Alteromonas macleodii]
MLHIPILVENADLIVVNKPVGVAMHDAVDETGVKQHPTKGIKAGKVDGIVTVLKKQLAVKELHLCHRLDTGTSGSLCLAKNATVAAEIGELFSSRRVSKYYLALSSNKPKKKQGMIIGDMKNRRGGQRILLKTQKNPAITQFFSSAARPGTRGFVVKPHSGKTHQIRVALKSVGAPILGDTLYGGAASDRLYLHAWHLRLPLSKGELSVTAPFDAGEVISQEDMHAWVEALNAPDAYPWPAIPARFLSESL